MSWSIEYTGSKEGVKAKVVEQLDKVAASYDGKAEAKDVLAAKERIVALVDALDLGTDAYGTVWNAVKVSANGSHSWTEKGVTSANFQVSVVRMSLAL